jgi:curved DNA-binding protein CbpA/GGDEF domain-containing protein
MKGKLTDQPLAELIREISSKDLSGTLRLEHERARTAIYFENGQIVFAASNLRTLRLREYLTKRKMVKEKELATLGEGLSDLGLATKLRDNGTLSQDQVDILLAILVTDVLRVALLWTEGVWEFDEKARLDNPVRVKIDVANLLREAAHRMPLKFVTLRFRNPNEIISRAARVSANNTFLPAESFILSRLDTPTKLEELVAVSGLRELDAQRMIYGLALTGVVKRQYWHNAFRTDVTKAPKDEIEFSVAPVVSVDEPASTNDRWGAISDDAELEAFLARLKQATNHYEVIDLPPAAEADEIKDAYYAVARRYHPDRFHLKSGTALHAKLSSAFARVTQAYETLTNSATRAAYDATLERARQFAENAPDKVVSAGDTTDDFDVDTGSDTELGQAEYNFREGSGALQQGRHNAAVTHLAAAARLAPGQARYRAYYGKALAASERTRRLAESEMQAAVKLEPSNATFRVMLAELYFELKFHRRAQTELDRALALDPNNNAAQLLLRKLDKFRKIG